MSTALRWVIHIAVMLGMYTAFGIFFGASLSGQPWFAVYCQGAISVFIYQWTIERK